MKMSLICATVGALYLSGCGGGGGDPGTCSGSPQWCAETDGVGSAQIVTPIIPIDPIAPIVSTTFVRVPDSDLMTVTCPEILALNGGDKVAFAASAMDAYQRGKLDLDGTPKNNIPCDSYL